eukprot:scaffold217_cov377-Prasinococcus_capsulatus_cf.AAC.10
MKESSTPPKYLPFIRGMGQTQPWGPSGVAPWASAPVDGLVELGAQHGLRVETHLEHAEAVQVKLLHELLHGGRI